MPHNTRRPIIDDTDAEILISVGVVLLAAPFLVAGAVWRWLRGK